MWDDSATYAVLVALDDEHWRVREMAANVVARHAVDDALDRATQMQADPVTRVSSAAHRAMIALISAINWTIARLLPTPDRPRQVHAIRAAGGREGEVVGIYLSAAPSDSSDLDHE